MANTTIGGMASSALSPLAADLLELETAGVSKKVTIANLFATPQPIGGGVPSTAVFTLLTVNQGTQDTDAFSLVSSDIAHGVTDRAPTSTYFRLQKHSPTTGGTLVEGFSESTVGLRVSGVVTSINTARTTAAVGAVLVDGLLKSGTGVAALGANGNLLVVRNNSLAQFLVDAEGDIHMNATSNINAWDSEQDIPLLNSFRALTMTDQDAAKRLFGGWLEEHAEILQKTGVVTMTVHPDGRREVFISQKGIISLVIDAIRQLGGRTERLEKLLT